MTSDCVSRTNVISALRAHSVAGSQRAVAGQKAEGGHRGRLGERVGVGKAGPACRWREEAVP